MHKIFAMDCMLDFKQQCDTESKNVCGITSICKNRISKRNLYLKKTVCNVIQKKRTDLNLRNILKNMLYL